MAFIEVPDTTPVQGPESEVVGNLVTNDFIAMLDARNQQIVVLLSSGVTSQTEIAEILGYANHSAISKRLVQIRATAEKFVDQGQGERGLQPQRLGGRPAAERSA